MADSNTQLHWTDEQWSRVRQVVYEEARRARVAGNVLPLYGPLEPDASYASRQTLLTDAGFSVDDRDAIKLITLRELVYLRGAQVADPELGSALIAFRRAANRIARREDELILTGKVQDDEESAAPASANQTQATPKPPGGLVGAVVEQKMKVEVAVAPRGSRIKSKLSPDADAAGGAALVKPRIKSKLSPDAYAAGGAALVKPVEAIGSLEETDHAAVGAALVTAVSKAIGLLEESYHLGPFACLLGPELFLAVQTPGISMVLPQERILPFLQGGALLRTSVLDPKQGVVVALGGAPLDLVVATDISVNFLQVTPEARFVFRVYEKIVLRVKESGAVALLSA